MVSGFSAPSQLSLKSPGALYYTTVGVIYGNLRTSAPALGGVRDVSPDTDRRISVYHVGRRPRTFQSTMEAGRGIDCRVRFRARLCIVDDKDVSGGAETRSCESAGVKDRLYRTCDRITSHRRSKEIRVSLFAGK